MYAHRSRVGISLVEVLVAIFIMAIGLIALLTLFPIGALSMKQALQDSRAAQVAADATAMAIAKRTRTDETIIWEPDVNAPGGRRDIYRDPLPYIKPGKKDLRLPSIPDGSPSYPVLVDPLGWLLNSSDVGHHGNKPGFPRRCPGFIRNLASSKQSQLGLSWRWFSNLSDIHFTQDGTPIVDTNTIERENRYSWTYLLRRPDVARPTVVDLTVVVSSGRPFMVNGNDLAGESTYYPVAWNSSSTTVQVPFTGEQPAFRKGCWVMDSTLPDGVSIGQQQPPPRGFWYRVVGVSGPTTISGQQFTTLELQDRPKMDAANGSLTLFEHVVEVFEKGPGWLTN